MVASKRFNTSSAPACISASMSAELIFPVMDRSLTDFKVSPSIVDKVPGWVTSMVFVVCAFKVQQNNTDTRSVNRCDILEVIFDAGKDITITVKQQS